MSDSMPQTPTAGQPIPIPPEFPIVWDDPRDAKVTWMFIDRDQAPIAPLSYAFVIAFLKGGLAGFEQAGLPVSLRPARCDNLTVMNESQNCVPIAYRVFMRCAKFPSCPQKMKIPSVRRMGFLSIWTFIAPRSLSRAHSVGR